MRRLLLGLLVLLASCAPSVAPVAPPVATADLATYQYLAAPFTGELERLGVSVTNYQTYRYEGADPNGFVEAINRFYLANPGFCPLVEAFYAAPSGLQFMTVAGNNGLEVRGFLYDQSRRPRLTYAYFSGSSALALPATVCATATPGE